VPAAAAADADADADACRVLTGRLA